MDGNADQIFTVDITTGAGTGIGAVGQLSADGFPALRSLAFDPTTDKLFGLDGGAFGVSAGELVAIDVTTGAATLIDDFPFASTIGPNPSALAVDPTTGTLYAVAQGSASGDQLYTVDKTTAALTLVGDLFPASATNAVTGLTFDLAGNLFATTTENRQLLAINPSTGAATLVRTAGSFTGDGANDIQGLAVVPEAGSIAFASVGVLVAMGTGLRRRRSA